ncbi:hypothetical protein ACQJ5I_01870 [Helicobacter pylori]
MLKRCRAENNRQPNIREQKNYKASGSNSRLIMQELARKPCL